MIALTTIIPLGHIGGAFLRGAGPATAIMTGPTVITAHPEAIIRRGDIGVTQNKHLSWRTFLSKGMHYVLAARPDRNGS